MPGAATPPTPVAPGTPAPSAYYPSPYYSGKVYYASYTTTAAPYAGYAVQPSPISATSSSSPSYLMGVDVDEVQPLPVAGGDTMSPARFAGHLLQRLESKFPSGTLPDGQVILDQALQFFFESLPWPWSSLPVSTFDRLLIEKLVNRFIQKRGGGQVATTAPPAPPADDAPARSRPVLPANVSTPTSDDSNVIEMTFRIKLPAGMKIVPK